MAEVLGETPLRQEPAGLTRRLLALYADHTLGGETFLIIDNDGSDPIQGTFNGLAEGTIFLADNHLFQISYQGGTGNDLVLTAVPEPTTWAMMGLGAAGVGYVWHRRRRQQLSQWEAVVEL